MTKLCCICDNCKSKGSTTDQLTPDPVLPRPVLYLASLSPQLYVPFGTDPILHQGS